MLLLILLSYTIPFDSPLMDNVEYLQIKKLIDAPSFGPYDIEWLVSQIDELLINETKLNKIDRKIISNFNPALTKNMDYSVFNHFMFEYQREPVLYYGFYDARLGGRLTKNITYSQALRFRFGSQIDSLGPRPWNDVQVYLNEGFVKFGADKLQFLIGRRNYILESLSEHSLLLSLDPQGYDSYLFMLPLQHYEFYTIFAILDATEQRYISIHRIGLNLKRFLKVGFSEAILFGNSLEPLYLNFFVPYYLAQWGIGRNDNIQWCFDAQINFFNTILYGEFLIDDYMFEDDPYPHKLAYQCGLKTLLFNKFLAKMNYTFVDKWVYTHRIPINVYEKNNYPLGFPLGNDVDELTFSVKFMNQYGLDPSVALNYIRKGEGNIFLPYEEEGGTWTPPFPSGTVERKLDIIFSLDYTFRYNFYIKADFGKRYWYNYQHTAGDDREDLLFDISLWAVL